jgi:hypothetical protein
MKDQDVEKLRVALEEAKSRGVGHKAYCATVGDESRNGAALVKGAEQWLVACQSASASITKALEACLKDVSGAGLDLPLLEQYLEEAPDFGVGEALIRNGAEKVSATRAARRSAVETLREAHKTQMSDQDPEALKVEPCARPVLRLSPPPAAAAAPPPPVCLLASPLVTNHAPFAYATRPHLLYSDRRPFRPQRAAVSRTRRMSSSPISARVSRRSVAALRVI